MPVAAHIAHVHSQRGCQGVLEPKVPVLISRRTPRLRGISVSNRAALRNRGSESRVQSGIEEGGFLVRRHAVVPNEGRTDAVIQNVKLRSGDEAQQPGYRGTQGIGTARSLGGV